jgi:hypothetical protein
MKCRLYTNGPEMNPEELKKALDDYNEKYDHCKREGILMNKEDKDVRNKLKRIIFNRDRRLTKKTNDLVYQSMVESLLELLSLDQRINFISDWKNDPKVPK